MTVTHMENSPRFGAIRPKLFRKTTRDALADVLVLMWPFGRRGAVKKAYALTEDQAKSAIRATAGWETFDEIIDRGGWALWLEIGRVRFGEEVTQHLNRERAKHEEQAARLAALAGAVRPFRPAGGARPADLGAVADMRPADRRRRVGEGQV